MPRPKTYDHDTVVRAARDLFWAHGYEATSLADLERVTGLNRSSIYQEFGSKHGLFTRAVDNYLAEIAEPRLARLHHDNDLTTYFTDLAAALRKAPNRGCLMVNAMAELAGHDPDVDRAATTYRTRIIEAMTSALQNSGLPEADDRAALLTGLVLGVMLTARLDTAEAATLAEAAAAEAASWRVTF